MALSLPPCPEDAGAWGRGCVQDAVYGHVGTALGGVGPCPVARSAREAARAVHGAAGVVAHGGEARHFWRRRPRRSGPVPWLVPCNVRQLSYIRCGCFQGQLPLGLLVLDLMYLNAVTLTRDTLEGWPDPWLVVCT